MFGFGFVELFVILAIIAVLLGVPTWAAWRVAHKAGFNSLWGLLMIIPIVNLVLLWVFAFIEWPSLRRLSSETGRAV